MAMTNSLKKSISHVIFDLDDTLLKTDDIVNKVLKVYLNKYGKEWNSKGLQIVGKTPLEAAASLVDHYELQCSTQDLLSEITPMFSCQWHNIKALPGAYRLIKHFVSCDVPMALASNSPRSDIESKISYHKELKDSFSVIIGGDEVKNAKPSPEIFLEAAKRLNSDPSRCLVVEDSIPGVISGKAAGMQVLAVPSHREKVELFGSADEVINSLFDFDPERWGLPSFSDWIEKTLPTKPWFIGGPVIKGFGRGSKLLGIPTANLAVDKFSDEISEMSSGVYFGWASLSNKGIYKMVMSVGWNPYFDNTEKTMEPWLLHEFKEDFYGDELRLAVIGYIRPEANFPTLESLIARIREDGRIAEKALDLPLYATYKEEEFLNSLA
ncbi:Riboflavin kinase [Zostera marina]|uniref:riboflavin kinase n=1 Tax=Zostera marina TaxID=29655 RepID=A0A0K9PA80_ZOSMR|nr:Riboflavin kinase [Zostera marina]